MAAVGSISVGAFFGEKDRTHQNNIYIYIHIEDYRSIPLCSGQHLATICTTGKLEFKKPLNITLFFRKSSSPQRMASSR